MNDSTDVIGWMGERMDGLKCDSFDGCTMDV